MAAVSLRAWAMAIVEGRKAMAGATSVAAASVRLPWRAAAAGRVGRHQLNPLRAVHRNADMDRASAAMEGNAWDGTTEVAEAEWSEAPASGQGSEQQQQQQQQPQEQPKAQTPYYDNYGKKLNFIALGRAMQLALDSQKDFEMFLEKCSAYGVMIPEDPANIRSNLCELDPKQTWIVCDTGALLKFAKKMAIEEAGKSGSGDYPEGYLEDMLDRADEDP